MRRATQAIRVLRYLLIATGEFAWQWLENRIRGQRQRQAVLIEHGLFLRQILLHLSGLRPIRNITCTGLPGEGAGSQALMIIKTILLARACGLSYMHTPFSFIRHAEAPVDGWAMRWEKFCNLGAGEPPCDVPKEERFNYCYNMRGLELCLEWGSKRRSLQPNFEASIAGFRRRFYLDKTPRSNSHITVAVHVRRGDVSATGHAFYFTETEKILRTTRAVKLILENQGVEHRIDIYSNGTRDELADFRLINAELHIQSDAVWTMRELIESDVLIMAKGCYSGYAALISDGIKIFEAERTWGALTGRWFEPPATDNWLRCLPDGTFDCAAFRRELLRLSEKKAVASELNSLSNRGGTSPE